MRPALAAASFCLWAAMLAPALAGDRAAPLPLPPGTYGAGCYWFRGSLYCSRYCYAEIDGHWYCQRRARDAVSQAPFALWYPPHEPSHRPPLRPVK